MVEIRNVLLIGRTGSGKSTLANIISESNHFIEGKYGVSKTRNTDTKEIFIDGINYRLIDTVGIGDTSLNEEQVLNKISDAAYVTRDGLNQVLFVTKDRFTKEEIEVYHILKKIIFDKDIGKYTTIVKTNFPDFQDEEECEKDKKLMEESKEMERVITSCCRIIHVDNPPLNIKKKSRIALNEEDRNHSRKILRTYLLNCRDTYRPNNLDNLNERIGEYVGEKEKLRKKLEELENLSKKEREKYQEEINKLKQKLTEQEKKSEREKIQKKLEELENLSKKEREKHQEKINRLEQRLAEQEKIIAEETRGWFERAGALLGEGVDNTISKTAEIAAELVDNTISKTSEIVSKCNIT